MNWLENFNEAVAYIEEHITEEIDYEKLAKAAGFPVYHFQKMFACMADISLSEYIRRRRMSLAAVDMQSGEKVIDVALKYGYNSPTAFNRAFQAVHRASPSAVKKGEAFAVSYPAMHFTLSVSGKEKLEFRIEKKDSFSITGITCPLSRNLEENFETIPHMWDKALADGTLASLNTLRTQEPWGLLGVSVHIKNDWRYFIAVSSSSKDTPWETYTIPAATWAIFTGRGTNTTLQELERRVIRDWLPTSGYTYAEYPDIEVYLQANPADCIYEYWLPVIKA